MLWFNPSSLNQTCLDRANFSAISGAHMNPAVTFTFVLRRCFSWIRGCGYIAAQLLGAVAAAATLQRFFGAALAVGIVVAGCGLFSSPISGASMNPARSFGPALLNGQLDEMWIYALGPLLGGAISEIIIQLLVGSPRYSERDAAHGKHQ
jgi:aquaporin Z